MGGTGLGGAGIQGSAGAEQGKIILSLPRGARVAPASLPPTRVAVGPGKMKWQQGPRQSSSVRGLASERGDEGAYFNFLLGPPHDKGEISPNIIISQKNTLWNHKKGNTVKPVHRGCPLNQQPMSYRGGAL